MLIVFGSGVGVGARAIASTARAAEPHIAWPISINIIRPPRRRDGRGARRALSLAEKTTQGYNPGCCVVLRRNLIRAFALLNALCRV
nr:hypothetical protein GCM10020063_082530 [Dactylosporangium thailandense]